jgi:hypothetical protein
MTSVDPDKAFDPRTRDAIVGVAAMGAVLAIGAGAGWGLRIGASVAVGAGVAVLNLYVLARIVGALVGARAAEDGRSGLWGLFAVLKVFALFGGVWALFASHAVNPIALIVGWGALPAGITFGTLFSDKSDRSSASRAKQAPPAGPPIP